MDANAMPQQVNCSSWYAHVSSLRFGALHVDSHGIALCRCASACSCTDIACALQWMPSECITGAPLKTFGNFSQWFAAQAHICMLGARHEVRAAGSALLMHCRRVLQVVLRLGEAKLAGS